MRVILRKMKMFALVGTMIGATLAMGKVVKADDSDMGTVVFSDYFVDNRNNWTKSDSNCVIDTNDDVATITHTSVGSDSKLTTKLRNLNPNKRYIVKGQIKGANLVQHNSNKSSSLTAYFRTDQSYGVCERIGYYGTGSISKIGDRTPVETWLQSFKFDFYPANDGTATLELVLDGDATGKATFDKLVVAEDTTQIDILDTGHLAIYVNHEYVKDSVVSSSKLNSWKTYINNVYNTYQDLTGYTPFNGDKIQVKTYKHWIGGIAIAGNPIQWDEKYAQSDFKSLNDNNDNIYGIMHELSHDFDHPSWNFDSETWSNFKIYLAYRKLGTGSIYRYVPNSSGGLYAKRYDNAAQFKNYMYTESKWSYQAAIKNRNKVTIDALDYCLVRMVDTCGWDRFIGAFKSTMGQIRSMDNSRDVGRLKRDKFDRFLDVLQNNYNGGGNEIRNSFAAGEIDLIKNAFGTSREIFREDFENSSSVQKWRVGGRGLKDKSQTNTNSIGLVYGSGTNSSKVLRICNNLPSDSRFCRSIRLEAGKKYAIKGKMKGTNICSTSTDRDIFGNRIGAIAFWEELYGFSDSVCSVGTFDWKEFYKVTDIYTTRDYNLALALGYHNSQDFPTGTAYFDDIVITEETEKNLKDYEW